MDAAFARARIGSYIMQRLAETDMWVVRAYEDGVPIPSERRQYRQQLRDALDALPNLDDPTAAAVPGWPNYDGSLCDAPDLAVVGDPLLAVVTAPACGAPSDPATSL